jgi:Domain of unknown function (DUF6321)
MKIHELLNEAKIKGVDGKACWKGKRYAGKVKKADGTYKDKCVPVGETIKEDEVTENFGNYYNENIASKVFSQYPDLTSEDDVLSAAWEHVVRDMGRKKAGHLFNYDEDFPSDLVSSYFYLKKQDAVKESIDDLARILELSGLNLSADEQFDIIEDMVESLALQHGVDVEQIWEDFESVDDQELLNEAAAWQTSKGKSKTGGLNAKGVASYRRENPGSKLQMAVTTKPSKLKPGSKAAKRRKSFCARMGGNKGPMKKPNGKPTRKALALRKWNC